MLTSYFSLEIDFQELRILIKICIKATRNNNGNISICKKSISCIFNKRYEEWKCVLLRVKKGLPSWLSGKESACQCRRHGFDPWADNSICVLVLEFSTPALSHTWWLICSKLDSSGHQLLPFWAAIILKNESPEILPAWSLVSVLNV